MSSTDMITPEPVRIVVIADDDTVVMPKDVEQADVLVSLGDIHVQTVERIADAVMPERVFAVRGNHDALHTPWPLWMEDLHGRTSQAFGLTFGGLAGSWRYKTAGGCMFTQEEARLIMQEMPAVDVLISHNSPASYHERDKDVHQGFLALTEYMDRCAPSIVVHGHQHKNIISRRYASSIIGCYGIRFIELHPAKNPLSLMSV